MSECDCGFCRPKVPLRDRTDLESKDYFMDACKQNKDGSLRCWNGVVGAWEEFGGCEYCGIRDCGCPVEKPESEI